MRSSLLSLVSALLLLTAQASGAQASRAQDLPRWKAQAARVTIIRDNFGVPHVYGRTDADAVFGMIYAQAEDDFNRVETNYINAMGRLAEVEGERELYRDLRMKLFIDTLDMKRQYAASPAWLKTLMVAWADGLNYFMATHPEKKPRLITRYQPWMALTFSEGSIGGDIESVNLRGLEQFYGPRMTGGAAGTSPGDAGAYDLDGEPVFREPGGSNGFAIAPSITATGNAMLLINPHTSFYFRPEIHVVSEQGLNAYGAVTWGQFFVYQGFNPRVGWMHTSGGGDVIDEYLETVTEAGGRVTYTVGGTQRPMRAVKIGLPYKTPAGMARKEVTVYYTHRGPVIRAGNGKWTSVRLMQEPLKALQQSYLRTKATGMASFRTALQLRTNSSNNTVYADRDGNIALFFGNFVPRRDPKHDYTKPLDGTDPTTDWQGLHAIDELVKVVNPRNGWIQNTNNEPWNASGPESPKRSDYPAYMSGQTENPRGWHAVEVLSARKDFTLERLIAAAYDSHLPMFDSIVPALVKAWESTPASDTLKAATAEQVAQLRTWDRRFGVASIPMTLAHFYGEEAFRSFRANAQAAGMGNEYAWQRATPAEQLGALSRASARLTRDFGTWKTPWGEVNRFQRLTGDIVQPFDDSKPSIPVAFASANWGSLAAVGMTTPARVKKIYADRGNSFVSVVEFGPRLRAKSILAGGQSGDPASKHFNDQAEMYAKGEFKDVLFYRPDVEKHAERTYRPGQKQGQSGGEPQRQQR